MEIIPAAFHGHHQGLLKKRASAQCPIYHQKCQDNNCCPPSHKCRNAGLGGCCLNDYSVCGSQFGCCPHNWTCCSATGTCCPSGYQCANGGSSCVGTAEISNGLTTAPLVFVDVREQSPTATGEFPVPIAQSTAPTSISIPASVTSSSTEQNGAASSAHNPSSSTSSGTLTSQIVSNSASTSSGESVGTNFTVPLSLPAPFSAQATPSSTFASTPKPSPTVLAPAIIVTIVIVIVTAVTVRYLLRRRALQKRRTAIQAKPYYDQPEEMYGSSVPLTATSIAKPSTPNRRHSEEDSKIAVVLHFEPRTPVGPNTPIAQNTTPSVVDSDATQNTSMNDLMQLVTHLRNENSRLQQDSANAPPPAYDQAPSR